MKITELRCPSCNGTLKIDDQNPNVAVCEYCKTKYVLEWEGDNAKIGTAPSPAPRIPVQPKPAPKNTGWEPYGWKRGLAIVCVGIVVIAAFYGPAILKKRRELEAESAQAVGPVVEVELQSEEEVPVAPLEGILARTVELIYDKPVEEVTDKELASIKWLGMKYGSGGDYVMMGYSTEDPYENTEAELTWLQFDRNAAKQDWSGLHRFTGLVKLSFGSSFSGADLSGLSIRGISCYGDTPGQVADSLEHPEELRELEITAGLDSLDGLEKFPSLERLSLDCYNLTEIRELANAKTIKDLTIENGDGIKDFSVLSVMPNLEALYVESEGLKDTGFVAQMPNLRSLGLYDTGVLNLNGLESRQDTLEEFLVYNLSGLKDAGMISNLTGLKKLDLTVPYNCPTPDLSPLTAMEDLKISGYKTVSFLKNMPNLKRLELNSGAVDNSAVFEGLTQLEYLKCASKNGDKLTFISKLPALKKLDLTGAVTYYDISPILNMPTLETLLMSGAECEINFGKLQENTSLTTLQMAGVKLYKNVQVSGGGGIVYVDWDDVVLDENTGFITHYPNLKTLDLSDNELTQVDFASGLLALEMLDISDNYVTDIKPLDTAASLKQVDCAGNPISNPRVLDEKVNVIQ